MIIGHYVTFLLIEEIKYEKVRFKIYSVRI